MQQDDYVSIASTQDIPGRNVEAGRAIGVRANTTPAYVIGPREARHKIPTPH